MPIHDPIRSEFETLCKRYLVVVVRGPGEGKLVVNQSIYAFYYRDHVRCTIVIDIVQVNTGNPAAIRISP